MSFINPLSKLFACVLFAAFYVTSASAETLFDNGLPNTQNGYSILGSAETRDDFMLEVDGNINHVTFYFQNYFGITDWNQDVTYNIWDAQSGGNLLATGAALNVTPVDSGLPWCCGGGNAWQVDFDMQADFFATAGQTYWLGLTGATGSSSAWWVTTDFKNGMSSQGDIDFAFALSGDRAISEPVPVNNSLVLALLVLLLGTAGIWAVRKYQS